MSKETGYMPMPEGFRYAELVKAGRPQPPPAISFIIGGCSLCFREFGWLASSVIIGAEVFICFHITQQKDLICCDLPAAGGPAAVSLALAVVDFYIIRHGYRRYMSSVYNSSSVPSSRSPSTKLATGLVQTLLIPVQLSASSFTGPGK